MGSWSTSDSTDRVKSAILVLSLLLLAGAAGGGEMCDSVVARVGNCEIFLSQIVPPDEGILARERWTREHGDTTAVPEPDPAELKRMGIRTGQRNLAMRIRGTVFLQMCAKYGIVPTDSVIVQEAVKLVAIARPESAAAVEEGRLVSLMQALDDIYDRGIPPDSAYAMHLAGKYEPSVWETKLLKYSDPALRERLRRNLQRDWRSEVDFQGAAAEWVQYNKMNDFVDREIAKEDEDYRRFLAGETTGVLRHNPGYDWEMRERWWQQRFREADIEILDERYRGALDILFKASPREKE